MNPLGELRAFIIFHAGASPPTVLAARGCTLVENIALSNFTVTPSAEVAQTGLTYPATSLPPGGVGGPTLMDAAIGTDAGAGYRAIALREDGGVGARVAVVDAAGAAALAAPGQVVVVRFWRTPPVS